MVSFSINGALVLQFLHIWFSLLSCSGSSPCHFGFRTVSHLADQQSDPRPTETCADLILAFLGFWCHAITLAPRNKIILNRNAVSPTWKSSSSLSENMWKPCCLCAPARSRSIFRWRSCRHNSCQRWCQPQWGHYVIPDFAILGYGTPSFDTCMPTVYSTPLAREYQYIYIYLDIHSY